MGNLLQESIVREASQDTVFDAFTSGAEPQKPRVLVALAATLERLVVRNETSVEDISGHPKLTAFHGSQTPTISIIKYLERIHKYSKCSPSCFLLGFIYIDHLVHRQPDVPITLLNVHRLLITSIMVAAKFLDDVHYSNGFYARIGGISNGELNSLELDFLFCLDFQLHVTSNMFEGYCTYLEKELTLAGKTIPGSIPCDVDKIQDYYDQEPGTGDTGTHTGNLRASPTKSLLDC